MCLVNGTESAFAELVGVAEACGGFGDSVEGKERKLRAFSVGVVFYQQRRTRGLRFRYFLLYLSFDGLLPPACAEKMLDKNLFRDGRKREREPGKGFVLPWIHVRWHHQR